MFRWGRFQLHSGQQSSFLIDCGSLTDEDWWNLAFLIASKVQFGSVEGVPRGGLALAKALEQLATSGPLLIVDDVLTTGASMEEKRAGREAIGIVLFARGDYPKWVMPIFRFNEALGVKGE